MEAGAPHPGFSIIQFMLHVIWPRSQLPSGMGAQAARIMIMTAKVTSKAMLADVEWRIIVPPN